MPERRVLAKIADWPAFLALWGERARAPRDPRAPTVVSTFAGAGGSSAGYRMAGARVLLATDSWDLAAATYRRNWSGARFLVADVTRLDPGDLMAAAGVGPGELDVLDGSPPCQGFSTAGKRQLDDPRNALFLDFCRLLRGVRPRAFVMENVSGVAKGPMRRLFREITRELKACGYDVACRLVDASWLGVPQVRKRLIWLGTRADLGLEARHPVPLWRQPSVMDAIGDLVGEEFGITVKGPGFVPWSRPGGEPGPTVTAHEQPSVRRRLVLETDTETRMRRGTFNLSNVRDVGGPAMTLRPSWRTNLRLMASGGRNAALVMTAFNRRRGRADRPAGTMTGFVGELAIPGIKNDIHDNQWRGMDGPSPAILAGTPPIAKNRGGRREPWRGADGPAGTQTAFRPDLAAPGGKVGAAGMHHREYAAAEASGARRLTAKETARLQGFPDWYEFEGSRSEQQAQIGNAVPPLMAAAVAMALFGSALGFSLPYYHLQEADALAGVGEDVAGPDPEGNPAHGQ